MINNISKEFIKDVKKGLNCCISHYSYKSYCNNCPYNHYNSENCIDVLIYDSLRVIKSFEIELIELKKVTERQ